MGYMFSTKLVDRLRMNGNMRQCISDASTHQVGIATEQLDRGSFFVILTAGRNH